MSESLLSYYNSRCPWGMPGREFLIRGFALRETMPPVIVHNGEKAAYPWPWLFIFFEDPVILNPGTPEAAECERSLMIWPAGAAHHYGNEVRKWTHSWMIVDFPEMEQFLKNRPLPVGAPFRTDAGRLFAKYLPMFHGELTVETPDSFFLKNLLQLFLYDLHRACRSDAAPVPQRVREMEQYLAEHLAEVLTVPALAAEFGLSAPHVTALFREFCRTSPMARLNALRMNRAARLLSLYPYSCKEIAELTGFRDALYFSRRFRQFWGMSPRDYRNRS